MGRLGAEETIGVGLEVMGGGFVFVVFMATTGCFFDGTSKNKTKLYINDEEYIILKKCN